MKVYIYENGLTIVGKAWQVRAKLKELQSYAITVDELARKRSKALRRKNNVIFLNK